MLTEVNLKVKSVLMIHQNIGILPLIQTLIPDFCNALACTCTCTVNERRYFICHSILLSANPLHCQRSTLMLLPNTCSRMLELALLVQNYCFQGGLAVQMAWASRFKSLFS